MGLIFFVQAKIYTVHNLISPCSSQTTHVLIFHYIRQLPWSWLWCVMSQVEGASIVRLAFFSLVESESTCQVTRLVSPHLGLRCALRVTALFTQWHRCQQWRGCWGFVGESGEGVIHKLRQVLDCKCWWFMATVWKTSSTSLVRFSNSLFTLLYELIDQFLVVELKFCNQLSPSKCYWTPY